jgi:1-acyl-sn-glycerol-3-phosphate acyltransferase
MTPLMAWRSLRVAGTTMARRNLDLRVEGAEHLPASGPALIASRHFHHLYDGCAYMATVPRPLHIIVGLDWIRNGAGKQVMTRLCRAANWPVVLRRDGETPVDDIAAARALRQAFRDSIDVLRQGHVLLVFPEGYPNIDPGYTPKADETTFLPFQSGLVRIATLAASQGLVVPIVPAGLAYERIPGTSKRERWRVTLRFGAPMTVTSRAGEAAALRELEARVRALSGLPDAAATGTHG